MSNATKPTASHGTLSVKTEIFSAPVELGVADELLAGLSKRLKGTKADTTEGYKIVRGGLAECRSLKRQVTDAHRELKASALAWGQACDAEKRRVLILIAEVAEPLQKEKARVDDEKERIKQEKLDTIRKAKEAIARAEAERLRKEQEAKNAEARRQNTAEAKRLNDLADKLEAENAGIKRKMQDEERRQAEQRRLIDKERAELDSRKREAEAEERRKIEAIDKSNRELAEHKAEADREAEMLRLAEERKPDGDKLAEFADVIDATVGPPVETDWAKEKMSIADEGLSRIALELRRAVVIEA